MTASSQSRLFPDVTTGRPALVDADVTYLPQVFPPDRADRLLLAVESSTAWKQETIQVYGREVPIPRLSAWYGDPGRSYSYSGIDMDPRPWTPVLRELKAAAEQIARTTFNSVLANLYRDGGDGVGWHADDEPELGPEPIIASVSLGATRRFCLRHRHDDGHRWQIELEHGSVLVMRGPTQRHWLHQLPKTTRPVGPRINLTFRTVDPPDQRSGSRADRPRITGGSGPRPEHMRD